MYLFFDTETTGLPQNYNAPVSDLKNWPRMVQLAWAEYDGQGNLQGSNNYIIKPEGYIIPADVSKVHGITTEMAESEGESLQAVLEEFAQYLGWSSFIVGHNISFDEKIIGAEFFRKNVSHTMDGRTKLCTMKLGTQWCAIPGPYGYKWPRLSDLHQKLFGVQFEGAHNALSDVLATARCFWEMKKLGIIK